MWNRWTRFKNVRRLRKIAAVFARHGIQNVAGRGELTAPERVRISFEQLGPTFVKLGQLLASRPDLIPHEWSEEFRKLHDQVAPIPFSDIEKVLASHFGVPISEVFLSFEEKPLAAASIAQVHEARLKDGTKVVVKVQRPGISKVIEEDLQLLNQLSGFLERLVPESRKFNPKGIIKEFGNALELETDFVVEANNIRRFQQNFAGDGTIKIPKVYKEYTGRRVLVMEALEGIPLTQKQALEQEGIDRQEILRRGLRAYLKMVYKDGFFHGDLHAGNLLILPNNQLGLVDFGVVGRVNRRTQEAITNMFLALASEDFDRMAYIYMDLAPVTEFADLDGFARDVRGLLAPYLGLTMKHVNLGRLLMQSSAIASQHGLVLPSELVLFFKSIVAIEGMGRLVSDDFDFLSESMAVAKEQMHITPDPKQLITDAAFFGRDVQTLLQTLPRQIKYTARRLNDPHHAFKVKITEIEPLRRAIERGFNHVFWGLIIAAAILGFILRYR